MTDLYAGDYYSGSWYVMVIRVVDYNIKQHTDDHKASAAAAALINNTQLGEETLCSIPLMFEF